jgi:hypothetical protein
MNKPPIWAAGEEKAMDPTDRTCNGDHQRFKVSDVLSPNVQMRPVKNVSKPATR